MRIRTGQRVAVKRFLVGGNNVKDKAPEYRPGVVIKPLPDDDENDWVVKITAGELENSEFMVRDDELDYVQ